MVNWTKRIITASLVAPCIVFGCKYVQSMTLMANCMNEYQQVFAFMLHNEFSKLVVNILKTKGSDSDTWYIQTLGSSWFIRVPTHYFLTASSFSLESNDVHLHLYISIIMIVGVRLLNFLKITDFLTSDKQSAQSKFPKEAILRSIQNITFSQIAADIIQFIFFVYPLCFTILAFKYQQATAINVIWLISSWQTDNGALFIGSAFGSTLFCPKISPNKTWEGVSGGIFLSVFTALILSQINFLSLMTLDALHTKHFLIISLIVSVVSIIGDLFESFIKRVANVKDSGNTFPGHGGVLDRMDSLCFSAPFVYLYITMFMKEVLTLA